MDINQIRDLLATNDTAVKNGLLILLSNQTADEQQGGYTNQHNGVGFNKYNAKLGTSLARRVKSGRDLTDRQMQAGRGICLKHARQLAQAGKNLTQPVARKTEVRHRNDRNPWNVPVIVVGSIVSDTYSHVMVRFRGKEELVRLPKKNIMWDGNIFVVPLQIAQSHDLDKLGTCTVEVS